MCAPLISFACLTLIGTVILPVHGVGVGLVSQAYADEGSHTGGHAGGRHSGGHDGGHDSAHSGHDDAHSGGPAAGRRGQTGTGGGPPSNTARSGRAVEDTVLRGGERKPWAREGIPEVEIGRLNVGRAPAHVLGRAEQEALATYRDNMSALYNLNAEEAAALLRTRFFEVDRYDSPLQNLALYKDLMTFSQTQLPGVTPASQLDLAAIFLGSASDKTIPISIDTIVAVNTILGLAPLEPEDQLTLAEKAEAVRAAILEGHGE